PPDCGVGFPWISLDSLVRIVTYQWVTRDKRDKIFSRGFSALLGLHVGGKSPPGIDNGRFGHSASLAQFVIFCNQLRPRPALAASTRGRLALERRAPGAANLQPTSTSSLMCPSAFSF